MNAQDEFYQNVEATIHEHGRMVIGVPDAGFSYTIGNYGTGLPELLILGVDPRAACGVLNAVSEAIKSTFSEAPPQDGDLIDIGGKVPVRLRALEGLEASVAREEYLIQAGGYYGRDDLPVMQVMVPDQAGRFPDDADCAEPYVSTQALQVR